MFMMRGDVGLVIRQMTLLNVSMQKFEEIVFSQPVFSTVEFPSIFSDFATGRITYSCSHNKAVSQEGKHTNQFLTICPVLAK